MIRKKNMVAMRRGLFSIYVCMEKKKKKKKKKKNMAARE